MQKVKEDLERFRQRRLEEKKKEEAEKRPEPSRSTHEEATSSSAASSPPPPAGPSLFSRIFDFDFFDILPLRLWRRAYETQPYATLIASVAVYVAGQFVANKAEFGIVFFMLALFVAMILSLDTRREGVSAYSVFNPNCERLLGQMTAEHFERDVLRRQR